MSFKVVRDIHHFADCDSDTIGRDVLWRQLHMFADKVDETIDAIIAEYDRRIAKQAGVMAETAERNCKLKKRLDAVVHACEHEISMRQSTVSRCEMCREDSSAGEDCPYNGEPCGCNSPTYGHYPTEIECEPFREIIRIAEEGEGK